MDQIEQYRVFVEVVDSGSFSKTARRMDVATSAISRKVDALETRLQTQLLSRSTRKMKLTDAGAHFYSRCLKILELVEQAETEVSANDLIVGKLSVSAPQTFGRLFIVPRIIEFLEKHPGLEIDLNLSDQRLDLVESGTDVAIRIGRLEDSTLRAKQIGTIQHIVCASPGYLEKRSGIEKPEDLSRHDCLCYSNLSAPGRWLYFDQAGKQDSVRVNPKIKANSGEALVEAAVAGLGVLCEPDFVVQKAIEERKLVALLTQWRWYEMGVYTVYPNTKFVDRRVRAFIDFISDSFAKRRL